MNGSAVDYTSRGTLAFITLNRPKRLNAINRALISGLEEAVHRANGEPDVRVIILRGAASHGYLRSVVLVPAVVVRPTPIIRHEALADEYQRELVVQGAGAGSLAIPDRLSCALASFSPRSPLAA